MDLAVNYRSRPGLVSLFGRASGEGAEVWQPQREGLASTTLAVAPHDAGQAEGIAQAMQAFVGEGYHWKELAILCRTRSQARNLRKALLARGLPIGPGPDEGGLLTRPDVRRLLALLAHLADPIGPARASALPEGAEIPHGADAYDALTELLYGKAGLARQLSEPEAVTTLLMLALAFRERETVLRATDTHPIRSFLEHLRRLARLGSAPSIPESGDPDTVRLLTVHGAKGLEFPVVFVPNLAVGRFPPRPGQGLLSPAPPAEGESPEPQTEPGSVASEEEARLFFVALSRARDHLVLSRAVRHGRMSARPSPLLECLKDVEGVESVFWKASEEWVEPPPPPTLPDEKPEIRAPDAELYLRCPKRYDFQVRAELPLGSSSPYESFKRAVLAALSAEKPSEALEKLWPELGPSEQDPSYGLYQKQAQDIVSKSAPARPASARPLMALSLESGTILVRPDDASETGQVERRTLRKPPAPEAEKADPDLRLSLLQEAFGPENVSVRFLQDGRALPVADKPRQRERHLDDYDRALRGIALQVFPATPGDTSDCPSCPFFFVCPRDGVE